MCCDLGEFQSKFDSLVFGVSVGQFGRNFFLMDRKSGYNSTRTVNRSPFLSNKLRRLK